jgi:uncharacterized protein YgbK (DUF1537 family)
MSKHPVTPMNESDLRLHLRRQGARAVHAFDLLALALPYADRLARFDALGVERGDFVLFDTLHEEDLRAIGQILMARRREQGQFVIASSGLEYALIAYLRHAGSLGERPRAAAPEEARQVLVVSGSASSATKAQLEHAFARGYAPLRVEVATLLDPARREAHLEALCEESRRAWNLGKSVALYSALGPDDPAIAAAKASAGALGRGLHPGALLGQAQGELARRLVERLQARRLVVAGGDTSGYVARALGIAALEAAAPLAPGSPLCWAHAPNPLIDGMAVALKGGQVGDETYFELARQGGNPAA